MSLSIDKKIIVLLKCLQYDIFPMKKALFIGGTGTISTAISLNIATNPDWELYVLNRGNRNSVLPKNVHTIQADCNNEQEMKSALKDFSFDCVCNFIGFVPEQIERDFRIFQGRTHQYMYISSASAYQKPLNNPIITEKTPLVNPYWLYSRNKIACEKFLMKVYQEQGFPITIIRPSHTYDSRSIPLGVHGKQGSWQVARRMLEGKSVIIHGDGTSLWTMTHAKDFAKGFIGLMGNPDAIGEAFQITSDETLTWNQIYQYIADALSVELKPYYVASEFLASTGDYDFTGSLIGDKANSVIFDNKKLKRIVPDYTPSIRFKDGVKETIAYVLSHPECQKEDKEFDLWCDTLITTLEKAKKEMNKTPRI